MIKDTLKKLIIRDLEKLRQEIAAYHNEERLWYTEKNISNSAGNLCLHLIGNLNTYIGAEFGKTGYIRNREDEFALKDVPRAELLDKIEKTITMIGETFDMITENQLNEKYPGEIPLKDASAEYFFVHLATHLGYHLGQINYHRRLLDN
ncbi:MAG: DinB family protein [Mucilaginibacter sp.]